MPSGADLEYARLLAEANVDQANAQGLDAARLEQINDEKAVDLQTLVQNGRLSEEQLKEDFTPKGYSTHAALRSLPNLMTAVRSYNDFTDTVIRVIGLGSSVGVGATLPDPTTQSPVNRLSSRLFSRINRLGNLNTSVFNGSVNGSTIGEATVSGSHYDNAKAAAGGVPKLVVAAYGMNDGGSAIYHAGQTYPSVYDWGKTLVDEVRVDGGDIIFFTTPHPHSGRTNWSLPEGISSGYPTTVAIPDTTNEQSIVSVTSPSGVNVPASYRHLRVNEAIRQLGVDTGCLVLDVEPFWFDAIAKYGEDSLFNGLEFAHPNLLGHQNSYWAAIEAFVSGINNAPVLASPYIPPLPDPYTPPTFEPTYFGTAYSSYGAGAVIDIPVLAQTAGTLEIYQATGDGLREYTVLEFTAKDTTVGITTYRTSFTGSSPSNISSIATSGLNVRVTLVTAHGGGNLKYCRTTRSFN